MKKVLIRLFYGAAVGILIGYLTVLLVNFIGGKEFMPAMPTLMQRCGSVTAAVLVQTLLTAVVGISFALASALFEIEQWSFLQQSAVHFLATAVVYVPFTMLCWYPFSWAGLLGLLGSVIVTYTINFLINYWHFSRDVQQINSCVQQARKQTEVNIP